MWWWLRAVKSESRSALLPSSPRSCCPRSSQIPRWRRGHSPTQPLAIGNPDALMHPPSFTPCTMKFCSEVPLFCTLKPGQRAAGCQRVHCSHTAAGPAAYPRLTACQLMHLHHTASDSRQCQVAALLNAPTGHEPTGHRPWPSPVVPQSFASCLTRKCVWTVCPPVSPTLNGVRM